MRRLSALFIAIPLLVLSSNAQTYTRHEISAGATYTRSSYFDSNTGGITGRYAFNVRPELAFETSFTLHPAVGSYSRSLTLFSGVKAGIRRKKWGIFGKAAPGFRYFFSYPDVRTTPTVAPYVIPTTVGRRHFEMELGGVLELYPTSRWFLRTDVSEVLTRVGDNQRPFIVTPIGPIGFGYEAGTVHSAISVSGGIGYRLGREERRRESPRGDYRRAEAGVQYALSNIGYADGFEMMDDSGLGFWGSYYLNRHVAIDGAVTHFWDRRTIISPEMGGNYWQAVAGAKMGITRERFGAYVKFRPGVVRFSDTFDNGPQTALTGKFVARTNLALDMGGVLEFYPTRHAVLRLDFSDVTIHYGKRDAICFSGPCSFPARTDSTIQTSFGFGWRF